MKYIPNLLTFFRLLLIPLYVNVFYSNRPDALMEALMIFIIASITDVLDGYLARKYNVTSRFGKIFDPLADKAMQLTALYTLADVGYIYPWLFWLFLIKEVLQIVLGGIIALKETSINVEANFFGKLTSALLFITIIVSVLQWPGADILQFILLITASITFIQYAVKYFKAVKNSRQGAQD